MCKKGLGGPPEACFASPSSAFLVLQLNQGQLTQLMANVTSSQDDGESKQLPDCVVGERGLVLTDLGRMQVQT